MSLRSSLRFIPATLLVAGVLSWNPAAHAASDAELVRVSDEVVHLVEEPVPETMLEIERRVEAGLPPEALTALLDAARSTPRADLEPTLRVLASYRSAGIRARALLALAELGPMQAVSAVRAAANDRDRGVRRLALTLARLHPSDPAEVIARTLLEEDETLASEEHEGPVVAAPAAPDAMAAEPQDEGADEEEVLLIEDEDEDEDEDTRPEADGAVR